MHSKTAMALTTGVVFSALFLSGWTVSLYAKPIVASAPSPAALCKAVGKELMPADSGEFYRIHYRNAACVETEVHIFYRPRQGYSEETPDGGYAIHKLRPDGTRISCEIRNRKAAVIFSASYALDGETVERGAAWRDDGTKKQEFLLGVAGEHVMRKYFWDGKSVFMTQIVKADGSYTEGYQRSNGTLWMIRHGAEIGAIQRQEEFDKAGKLAYIRDLSKNTYIEIGYWPSGSVKLKRFYKQAEQVETQAKNLDDADVMQQLYQVDEFAQDGKTVVRRTFIDFEASPKVIEEPQPGGDVLIRKLHPDGTEYYHAIRTAGGRLRDVNIDAEPHPVRQDVRNANGTTTTRTFDSAGYVLTSETRSAKGKIISSKKFNPAKDKKPVIEEFEGMPIESSAGGFRDAPLDWWMQTEADVDSRTREPEGN